MSLHAITPFAWWLGLLALAGALFALQRLRVRHRELKVVTTLFWREALEESRARVLVERFRHPLAYLLFLLFAALVWLAAAEPRWESASARPRLFVLDASAGMRGQRFERARQALVAQTRSAPANARTVVAIGGFTTTLLAPGEDARILERRLERLEPAGAPANLERELARWSTWSWRAPPLVRVFGDAPVRSEALALLPAGWTLERAPLDADEPGGSASNRGITAFGVAPARSGDYERVDVLVEVAGSDAGAAGLAAALDGEALASPTRRIELGGDRSQFVFVDVPARGGELRVALASDDALAADDRAAFVLPERRRLRVAVSDGLDARVRLAVDADPGLVAVESGRDADVAILRQGTGGAAGVPVLEWTSESTGPAFAVRHAGELDADDFARTLALLGLDQIDSTALAESADREIRLEITRSDTRSIAVWESLLGPGYDFVDSRSFPLFLARSVRWLAGESDALYEAAAGEPLPGLREALQDASARNLDPVGAPFIAPRAGEYRAADGELICVSLLDAATTERGVGDSLALAQALPGRGWSLSTWLVLAALAVLAFEWFLVRTTRVP